MRQVGGIHPVVNLALVESERTVLRDRSRMALCIVGNDTHTKAAALFCMLWFYSQNHSLCFWILFAHCSRRSMFLAKTSVCAASIAGGFEYSQRKIGLSTVKVHRVEPSVIVKQNVLRDFTTQEKKEKKHKKGGTNE